MIPEIQAVSITVKNLKRSKHFYENILGFEPDIYYEATRWQSYKSEGRAYFCITEDMSYSREKLKDIINFDIENIDQYWKEIKEKVEIESVLEKAPWGTYKFVIRDLDGYRIAFCQNK